ncbi:DNA polymerase III, alpha subunit [Desulfonatronospira thiodismutans ASO3-1]|uniref:DNA polymerase III subunit alpha n=1 Tax=Desulfonatronospira thiodismutans ASO3-1 TaxID=555779 RepID=D6SN38_9BACT|nr:DNA polymerase III subunit alpha [Desulfonatronospira thiodismutans]EFI36099.1 DNA polymerase III, alpha subunit [Desulfonatronospira thiodismutans ASO3-1]
MSEFAHLHCHTEYSLFEGCIRIEELCSKAAEYKMPAVSITDSGNLYGAMKLYSAAREYGIKPIIGCEINLVPGKVTDRDKFNYHLVLLAMDLRGYHNLVKLVSAGWLQGFYYKPRVDKDMLQKYSDGIIALSACLKGEVQYLLRAKGFDQGLEAAMQYARIYPDRFYLELEASGYNEQAEVNDRLMELSEKTGLPIVAANDCRYLTPQDAEAHAVLKCIKNAERLDEQDLDNLDTRELYFKSPEEMEKEFSYCPTALENVHKIVEQCNLDLDSPKRHLPRYKPTIEDTLDKELTALALNGLDEKLATLPYKVDREKYFTRLDKELKILCEQGKSWYFLVVYDYVAWARSRGIAVGPGRGSAPGCMTAYALGITGIDPILHKLHFERFCNTKRAGVVDIDVDLCQERRQEVFDYVFEKYGQNSVVYISVFICMRARTVFRDVSLVIGISPEQAERIIQLIPQEPGMTISKAMEMEPALRSIMNDNEKMQRCFDICTRLEGLIRHITSHAARIVISNENLQDYLPLYRGRNHELIAQYDYNDLERLGFPGFDLLGLKYLSLISRTLDLIKASQKQAPDMDSLPLDDAKTFVLIEQGHTDGAFQLEGDGFRQYLRELKPERLEDLAAMLALYRPGPLVSGMLSNFIKRRHGRVAAEYAHAELADILKETHGMIIYHEQVMTIAHKIAGFSLEDAEILAKNLVGKKPEALIQQKEKFIKGAMQKNNVPVKTAEQIFDMMKQAGPYGYLKAHSIAYAMISYQTAFLKANYPEEFQQAKDTVFGKNMK